MDDRRIAPVLTVAPEIGPHRFTQGQITGTLMADYDLVIRGVDFF